MRSILSSIYSLLSNNVKTESPSLFFTFISAPKSIKYSKKSL